VDEFYHLIVFFIFAERQGTGNPLAGACVDEGVNG